MSDGKLAIHHHPSGTTALLVGTMFQMLVAKGVFRQGEVTAQLERLSRDLMSQPNSSGAIGLVDLVRDIVAGEVDRKPS